MFYTIIMKFQYLNIDVDRILVLHRKSPSGFVVFKHTLLVYILPRNYIHLGLVSINFYMRGSPPPSSSDKKHVCNVSQRAIQTREPISTFSATVVIHLLHTTSFIVSSYTMLTNFPNLLLFSFSDVLFLPLLPSYVISELPLSLALLFLLPYSFLPSLFLHFLSSFLS